MDGLKGFKEIADHVEKTFGVKLLTVDRPTGDAPVPFAAVPNGYKVEGLKPVLDAYLPAPERKKGTAKLTDLPSFIAHVSRFKDAESAIFALRDREAPRLLGVIDYHRSAEGSARWGEHRALYEFPLSDEWKAWHEKDGEAMGQADFAAFIEERVVDVIEPPDELGDALQDLQRTIGGIFAGPTKLTELSRGMSVSTDTKAKSAVNLASGEGLIHFEETHQDGAGAPLKVPPLFLIAIPVFDRGPLYQIAVRLRYRLRLGAIAWSYQLFRPEKSFDHAFDEACAKAQQETALPLFYGAPEA